MDIYSPPDPRIYYVIHSEIIADKSYNFINISIVKIKNYIFSRTFIKLILYSGWQWRLSPNASLLTTCRDKFIGDAFTFHILLRRTGFYLGWDFLRIKLRRGEKEEYKSTYKKGINNLV